MKETFGRLVKQGSIYALGNFLFKVAGFLLAFIYLDPDYLAEAAYGRLALLDTTAKVLIPLLTLGISTGLLKFWADPEYASEKGVLVFTSVIAVCGCGVAAFILVALSAPYAAEILLGSSERAGLFYLLGGYMACKIIATTPTKHLRNEEKAGWMVAAIALEMVLLVAGVYYFLVVEGLGLIGVMQAYLLSAGVSAAVLVGGVLVSVPWKFKPEYLRRLVRFGMPLAWVGIGAMLLSLGDRYLLQWLTGPVTVGIYDWSGRLGNVLYMLFVSSFQLAFTVHGVKALSGDVSEADLHRRTFRHFVIWTGWAALGLSLLAYDVTLLVSDSAAYLAAEYLVLPVAIGYLFYGVYTVMNNLLYAGGRTKMIARNIYLTAGLNIILNLALIPLLGAFGAALATAISYAGLVAVTTRIAYTETTTRFPWMVLAKVLTLILGLYLLGRVSFDWSLAGRLSARIFLIGLYPLGIYLWGLYTNDEWKELGQIIYDRLRV